MDIPKGIKPEDEGRIVELKLGGASRALCYPEVAIDHFMDTYDESPCHVAMFKLRKIEAMGGDGPDKRQLIGLANPKWVIALLHSGLIVGEPGLKRETVRRWVWESFEGKDGFTLQVVSNALGSLVMLALERWGIANFGLEKRAKAALKSDRPTKAAKPSAPSKGSAATSSESGSSQSAAG